MASQFIQEPGYNKFALVPLPGLEQKYVHQMKFGQSEQITTIYPIFCESVTVRFTHNAEIRLYNDDETSGAEEQGL